MQSAILFPKKLLPDDDFLPWTIVTQPGYTVDSSSSIWKLDIVIIWHAMLGTSANSSWLENDGIAILQNELFCVGHI